MAEKSSEPLESRVKLFSIGLGFSSELASNARIELEEPVAMGDGAVLESVVELDAWTIGAVQMMKKIAETQTPRERRDMRFPFPDKARPVRGTHHSRCQQRALIQTHHFAQLPQLWDPLAASGLGVKTVDEPHYP